MMKFCLFRSIALIAVLLFANSCCNCLVETDISIAAKLQQGEFIRLKCLGNLNDSRWLQVRSSDGAVVLVKDSLAIGTKWYVHKKDTNVYVLQSLENLTLNTFLDGRTVSGNVGMAPDTMAPYSGTKWRIYDLTKGEVAIKCLGSIDGFRWLNGQTANATVGLSYYTVAPDGNGSGTVWQIQRLAK
jgi:hypothetical protein